MGNWPQTALWDTDPDMYPGTESCGAHTACSRGRREGTAIRREDPNAGTQDADSPPPMGWISPLRASFMVLRRSGANGRRSASRFDLARRIRIAMLLPARFCSYSSPLSMVTKISKPALSARSSREPFFVAGEACLGYGVALMIRQAVLEFPWDALVEENLHPSWPTSRGESA